VREHDRFDPAATGKDLPVRICRIFGHRMRFRAEERTMVWSCERCGESGSKEYASVGDAERYARAFDHEDRDDLGRRAPFIGLLPLRIWRRMAHGGSAQKRTR
jgi:hypothetical protein